MRVQMKFSAPVATLLTALIAFSTTPSPGWMGIKSKARPARTPEAARIVPAAAISDSAGLSATVRTIPAGSRSAYLGTLEGVRCFNCAPDIVFLNLGDSISRETATLTLRSEVWNAMDRPIKDKRMFDYDNRCFFFGYQEKDTVLVGGAWTETSPRSVACYPYLQRSERSGPGADTTVQAFRSEPAGEN